MFSYWIPASVILRWKFWSINHLQGDHYIITFLEVHTICWTYLPCIACSWNKTPFFMKRVFLLYRNKKKLANTHLKQGIHSNGLQCLMIKLSSEEISGHEFWRVPILLWHQSSQFLCTAWNVGKAGLVSSSYDVIS